MRNILSKMRVMGPFILGFIAVFLSLEMNSAYATEEGPTSEQIKELLKMVVNSEILESEFPQEQANLKKTFVHNDITHRYEKIQDALCFDVIEWVQTDPKNNNIGYDEHNRICYVRLHSVERVQTGIIPKFYESYLLQTKVNLDKNKLKHAFIEDIQKFQYDFDSTPFKYIGVPLKKTYYVCGFNENALIGHGVKLPLLNSKIQYKKKRGSHEDEITVETDGKEITAISVIAREDGKITYLSLMNKEEVRTQFGLRGDGQIIFYDYDPNTGSAGSPPIPVPVLLRCFPLDNGMPTSMKH